MLLVHSLTLRLANLFLPPRARLRIWSRSDKPAACGFLLLSLCSPQLLKPSGAGRRYQLGPGARKKKKKKRFLPPFSSAWKVARLRARNLRLEPRQEEPAARERQLKPPPIACGDAPVASDGISLNQAFISTGGAVQAGRGGAGPSGAHRGWRRCLTAALLTAWPWGQSLCSTFSCWML